MDSWVLILWVIIRYYLLLLLKLFQLQLPRAVFSWLLCPLWHTPIRVACFFLKALPLFSGITIRSMLILYISCPSPRTGCFSKSPGSFHWRMALTTKMWVLGVLIAPGMSLLIGLLSWQSKETYVSTNLRIHISTNNSIRNHLYL